MVRCGMQAREADGGVGFVDRAVGFDPQVVFGTALAGAQRRGAGVAGAGVDAVEYDHGPSPSEITPRAADPYIGRSEAVAQPNPGIGQPAILRAKPGIGVVLHRRHHADLRREPVAERSRFAKQRRTAQRGFALAGCNRPYSRCEPRRRATLDEDAGQKIVGPCEARIGRAGLARRVRGAADVEAGIEDGPGRIRRRTSFGNRISPLMSTPPLLGAATDRARRCRAAIPWSAEPWEAVRP